METKHEEEMNELPSIHYECIKMVGDITVMTKRFNVSGKSLPDCYRYIVKCKTLSEKEFEDGDE